MAFIINCQTAWLASFQNPLNLQLTRNKNHRRQPNIGTISFVICLVRNHFVHVCALHEQIATQVSHFHQLAKASQNASPGSNFLQLIEFEDASPQCRRTSLRKLQKIAQLSALSGSSSSAASSSSSLPAGALLEAGLGDALGQQGDHIAHVLRTDHVG